MDMGYIPSESDRDVWMKRYEKANVTDYYKYILCYVDDILHLIEHRDNSTMKEIKKHYYLKEGSVGPFKRYLGINIDKVQKTNGAEA